MSGGRASNNARKSLVVDDFFEGLRIAGRNVVSCAVEQPLQPSARPGIGCYRLVPRVLPLGLKVGKPGKQLVQLRVRQRADLGDNLLHCPCHDGQVYSAAVRQSSGEIAPLLIVPGSWFVVIRHFLVDWSLGLGYWPLRAFRACLPHSSFRVRHFAISPFPFCLALLALVTGHWNLETENSRLRGVADGMRLTDYGSRATGRAKTVTVPGKP